MESLELLDGELPSGFGIFPYIIIKMAIGFYIQIPIRFLTDYSFMENPKFLTIAVAGMNDVYLHKFLHNNEVIELFKVATRETSEKYRMPAILVTAYNQAYYFEKGRFKESVQIPDGGILKDATLRILARNKRHYYNLQPIRICLRLSATNQQSVSF
jgi:hypothetical protein